MLNSFPVCIAIGTVLGILSGLGTGGGSLLILWLTMALSMDPSQARVINLLFFLPAALIACVFRWKQGQLHIKKILPAILAGSIASGIFAYAGMLLHTALLKKLFGALLIFIGIRELRYRPKQP